MSNLVIQTNVLALNSHRNLKTVGTKLATSSARLSSGYKINSAADDASGLAISEKMRAQIRGLDMASKNTQDGISLVQTAEGGLQEVDNMVQRIRELAVQASNDTNDYATNDRKKLQDEINQLTQGIDAMAGQVEFNAKKLLDGSLMDAQTKAELLADIDVRLMKTVGVTSSTGGGAGAATGTTMADYAADIASDGTNATPVSTGGAVYSDAKALDAAVTTADGIASTGITVTFDETAFESLDKMKSFVKSAGAMIAGFTAARASATAAGNLGDVTDLDKGIDGLNGQIDAARKLYATAKWAETQESSYIALDAINGNGLWFQTGSNSMQGIVAGVGSLKSDVLGIGYGHGVSSIDVNNASGEQISAFIDIVDTGLQYVTSQRAKLGAVQNRMEYTKSSLDITSENLSASESRIRDTDMAKEMMKLTAANVLQQSGISMLAQANQSPQSVLSLLR